MEWKSNSSLWAVLISCCSLLILSLTINFCLFTYFINTYFLFYVGIFEYLKPSLPAWAPTCLSYSCTSHTWQPGTCWSETWRNSAGLSLISLTLEDICYRGFPSCPLGELGCLQPLRQHSAMSWCASLVLWGEVHTLSPVAVTSAITCQGPHCSFDSFSSSPLDCSCLLERSAWIWKLSFVQYLVYENPFIQFSQKEMGWYTFAYSYCKLNIDKILKIEKGNFKINFWVGSGQFPQMDVQAGAIPRVWDPIDCILGPLPQPRLHLHSFVQWPIRANCPLRAFRDKFPCHTSGLRSSLQP